MNATDARGRAAAIVAAANDALMKRDLARAKALSLEAVKARPDSADGWHLLGLVAIQEGRPGDALGYLARTLTLTPDAAPAHANRGAAYQALGRMDEAMQSFRQAAVLKPDSPVYRRMLAFALFRLERWDEAAEAYAGAVAHGASGFDVHFPLAQALRRCGRLSEAREHLSKAGAIEPNSADAWGELGEVDMALQDYAGAVTALRRAAALAPQRAALWNNLGAALREAESFVEAAAALQRALAIKPDFTEARLNLGNVHQAQNRIADALADYEQALASGSRVAESYFNMATAYQRQGDFAAADAHYARAIAAQPDFHEVYYNKGLNNLAQWHLGEGWREWEHRWGCAEYRVRRRPFLQPRWDGRRDLAGALLAWSEQGLGDDLLYGTMMHDLCADGIQVVWEVDARLIPVLARSYPGVRFIARSSPPDPQTETEDIAAQIPVGSLGQFLRPDLASFPTRAAHLTADRDRAARLRGELLVGGKRLVGISWRSANQQFGRRKSVSLAAWADILKTPGVRFVDLQYGDTAADRAEVAGSLGVTVDHVEGLDLMNDLDGVAALTAACDLVITVSNVTAHFGGGLGVPTWVLVPGGWGKLWYWGNEGATTPWYPSVRLFRQPADGDWNAPISEVAAALGHETLP